MTFALSAVYVYRRYVSPWKGFRCAYAVAHGRGSCSDVGLRLATRVSFRRFIALMSLQAARCRAAVVSLQSQIEESEGSASEAQINKDAGRQVLRCCGNGVACCPWP